MSIPALRTQKAGVGDGVRQLVDVSPLLPAQWQPQHDGVYATPAGHLFAAVLESAVHEFELYRSTRSKQRGRLYAKALAWFLGDPQRPAGAAPTAPWTAAVMRAGPCRS